MKISDLKANPKNPRKISEKKLEMLKGSLIKFGDLSGFVFNRRSGNLVSGHQRQKSLPSDARIKIEMKYAAPTKSKTVAEGYVEIDGERFKYREVDADLTWETEAMLSANKSGGEWDEDILKSVIETIPNLNLELVGFDIPELKPFNIPEPVIESRQETPEPDEEQEQSEENEDETPTKVEARTKLGDTFQLGEHRLRCGDSTKLSEVDQLFRGDSAELCFTSPPYSNQREYNGGKELSTEVLSKFIPISRAYVNYFCVNLGYARKEGEVFSYWDDYIKTAKLCGLNFLSWNVWNKGECGSIGNQTAMFGISHEWIFVFGKEKKALNRTVPNKSAGENANHNGNRQPDGTILKMKDRIVQSHSQLKTVYDCVPQKERDEIDHPARFPVRFPKGYIEAMTNESDFVYEPFGGSGSTLIACEQLNRKCLIMELDPHYCDIIISRYEKFTGKQAVKLA